MCGLAGIISTQKTNLKVEHLNILGTLNDERGGDSCGVFIDGTIHQGLNQEAEFRSFTYKIKYPKQSQIALVHCRKASVGYPITKDQCQPIVITDTEGNVEFVVMHNGTITNAKTLAQQYIPHINTFGWSDTQIMTYIFYYTGYEVLKTYTGTAVFVIVDYRSGHPEIFFWQGSSVYNEPQCDYERPFFFMVHHNKFYFSSMYCSLTCISTIPTIYTLKKNTLIKLDNLNLVTHQVYDRSTLVKPISTPYTYSNNYYPMYNYINYNNNTGLYTIGGTPAHGVIQAFPSGAVSSQHGDEYYFYQGRLLYNKECYDFLIEILSYFNINKVLEVCPAVIDYFAYSPIRINGNFMEVLDDFTYSAISEGLWLELFSNSYQYTLKDTGLTKTIITPYAAAKQFLESASKVYFNYDELEERIFKFIDCALNGTNLY